MAQESDLPSEDLGEPSVIIGQALVKVQDAAATLFLRVRLRLAQSFTVFSIILLLLWIAAFLYGSFYFSYMPRAAFQTPVYYYYRTDCESPSSFLCSYPVANVSLMRDKKHVLTFGQVYRLSLQLEMPDSQTNQDLGMFMIKTTCYSQHGQIAASARSARQLLKASSSRFGMLRYRSDLLKTLGTLLFLPFFLTGAAEQKQVLEVELFSEYIDDPYAPSVTAFIEILSSKVQIYASELYIHAHFTGLRYLLFQFPIISAFVGVSTNFIFLSFLFILSYTRQLLGVGEKPDKLTRDRLQAEMENTTNDLPQDNKDVAAGTAELMGPEQTDPTDPDGEDPSSHTGNNTEMQNGDTLVQG
ncbi:seipin-like [Melanotaenia boesemani]|uniref:seipin-like n=1 Tax=Melanotaenia boesemani TaxID=1250792 RepID=UPI001C050004|nr:seipin-like [Melanotaenia boesemani]